MKSTLYRKLIAAAVVFVIIGMPLGSYLYLRQGLSFRINALDALKVDEADLALQSSLEERIKYAPNAVNAIIDANTVDATQIKDVYEKYKGNKYFNLITLGGVNELGEKHQMATSSNELNKTFEDVDMVLVDTSGQVRQSYVYSDDEFKKFVQELTVLLPVESSKKIKLDR